MTGTFITTVWGIPKKGSTFVDSDGMQCEVLKVFATSIMFSLVLAKQTMFSAN